MPENPRGGGLSDFLRPIVEQLAEDEQRRAEEYEKRAERFRDAIAESAVGLRDLSLHLVAASVGVVGVLGPVLLLTQGVEYPAVLRVSLVGFLIAIVTGLCAVRRSHESTQEEVKWYFNNVQRAHDEASTEYRYWQLDPSEVTLRAVGEAREKRREKTSEWLNRSSRGGDRLHGFAFWAFVVSVALLGVSLMPWDVFLDRVAEFVRSVSSGSSQLERLDQSVSHHDSFSGFRMENRSVYEISPGSVPAAGATRHVTAWCLRRAVRRSRSTRPPESAPEPLVGSPDRAADTRTGRRTDAHARRQRSATAPGFAQANRSVAAD